jgi:haloacetate dehalogenase
MSRNSAQARALMTRATATPVDYACDPTHRGSAEVGSHFEGFEHVDVRTSGAVIRLRHGGSGPPLLPVHGNPRNTRAGTRWPRALRSTVT